MTILTTLIRSCLAFSITLVTAISSMLCHRMRTGFVRLGSLSTGKVRPWYRRRSSAAHCSSSLMHGATNTSRRASVNTDLSGLLSNSNGALLGELAVHHDDLAPNIPVVYQSEDAIVRSPAPVADVLAVDGISNHGAVVALSLSTAVASKEAIQSRVAMVLAYRHVIDGRKSIDNALALSLPSGNIPEDTEMANGSTIEATRVQERLISIDDDEGPAAHRICAEEVARVDKPIAKKPIDHSAPMSMRVSLTAGTSTQWCFSRVSTSFPWLAASPEVSRLLLLQANVVAKSGVDLHYSGLIMPLEEPLLSEPELEGENSLSESLSLDSDDDEPSLGFSGPLLVLPRFGGAFCICCRLSVQSSFDGAVPFVLLMSIQ
eukprot:IDg10059t1